MRLVTASVLVASLLASSQRAGARELPFFDVNGQTVVQVTPSAASERAASALGATIASRDPSTGMPRFIWAARGSSAVYVSAANPTARAQQYLSAYSGLLGVDALSL